MGLFTNIVIQLLLIQAIFIGNFNGEIKTSFKNCKLILNKKFLLQ